MRKVMSICLYLLFAAVCYANSEEAGLTFAQAADLAAAYSADLRHARSSHAIMESARRWGLRAYFPRLSVSVSENDRLAQIGSDSFIKNYSLGLDQLIFDGGRTSMSRKLERMELNLSTAELDRMADDIAEQAISAYRNVLSSRAILEIKKRSLVILEEQRRILNEEVFLGLALAVDLINADLNLTDAMIGIFSLQLDIVEMERQFAEILGLDSLPVLTERVDVNRSIILPTAAAAAALAMEKNPDLIKARFSILKRQTELKIVSYSWVPSLRLSGNFGLTGQQYPLTRYNWSVGINIEFSDPMFQNRFSVQAGLEPPYDKTAVVQNSFTPLPDPASRYGRHQAKLALALEQEKYSSLIEQVGKMAANAVEKCVLAEQKRILSVKTAVLGNERCRIEEIRLNLGQITRLQLMEKLIEQTQREIAVIEAAAALLGAERELERFLDLKPGELAAFASSVNALSSSRRN